MIVCRACSPVDPWVDGQDCCPYCGYHQPPERVFTESQVRTVLEALVIQEPVTPNGEVAHHNALARNALLRSLARGELGIDLDVIEDYDTALPKLGIDLGQD